MVGARDAPGENEEMNTINDFDRALSLVAGGDRSHEALNDLARLAKKLDREFHDCHPSPPGKYFVAALPDVEVLLRWSDGNAPLQAFEWWGRWASKTPEARSGRFYRLPDGNVIFSTLFLRTDYGIHLFDDRRDFIRPIKFVGNKWIPVDWTGLK